MTLGAPEALSRSMLAELNTAEGKLVNAMQQEELKATLAQLHQQLQSGAPIDPEILAMLQQLSLDVDQVAGEKATPPSVETPAQQRQSLIERMLGLTEEFEETHPQLAEAIGRVATALSRIGI